MKVYLLYRRFYTSNEAILIGIYKDHLTATLKIRQLIMDGVAVESEENMFFISEEEVV